MTFDTLQNKLRHSMTAENMAVSASLENYLEVILVLIRESKVARSRDIAARLKVKRASVTGALQALGERGLINYEPYGFVTLTVAGEKLAGRVLRRHEVLRDFFVNVLGIDRTEADEAACRMEHGVSKTIVDRLVDFVRFVDECPRAGPEWIRGFARQCAGTPANAADCKKCIQNGLSNLPRKHPKTKAKPRPPA